MENRIYIAIIVAGGKGRRMKMAKAKQLLPYKGDTVIEKALEPFAGHEMINSIILVIPESADKDLYLNAAKRAVKFSEHRLTIVRGGKERGDSVFNGLITAEKICKKEGFPQNKTYVLIHDGARPEITKDIISRNIEMLEENDAVCTAIPATDSMRIISDSGLNSEKIYPIINSKVLERRRVLNVQTPQSFRLDRIISAYRIAKDAGYNGTDDASVAEYAGMKVAIAKGDYANIKITTRKDLPMEIRMGNGYDVHRLVPGKSLILCGVPVPSRKGLLGHSDADVATHAIMDAILGATAKGDIGKLFPDSDERYKGISSLKLLSRLMEEMNDINVANIDVTIIAERPKLSPYTNQMREKIAGTLGISKDKVSIKATTTEGLGFAGREEGIAAIATCVIEGRFQ